MDVQTCVPHAPGQLTVHLLTGNGTLGPTCETGASCARGIAGSRVKVCSVHARQFAGGSYRRLMRVYWGESCD